MSICVECGDTVESLYVEFSEGNIKLTRCPNCRNVCDKYIEFEPILVIIDIILHRKSAYRHVLFNRHELESVKNSLRLLTILIILMNSLLKFIVLHDEFYVNMSFYAATFHILTSSVLEHSIFVFVIIIYLLYQHDSLTISNNSKYIRKIYFAIVFPEYFKIIALLLQLFDSEWHLLLLFGSLLLSIQLISIQSFLNTTSSKIARIVVFGGFCRLLVRVIFFSFNQILSLGIIS